MIEQYTSPAVVNNSQEPWLVGEGVSLSGSIAIPSLDFNFVTNAFPGTVTFTRASTATYFDSAGVLQSAAIDVPRLDYDPATLLPRGFLVEEQRTNSIRNNTMQGAVAGTPGTLPTNWGVGGISGGLATQIVGTGTENGINYIDIRIFGTNSLGVSVFPGVFFDTTTGIAGTTGQVWSESLYLSLAAGTGINFDLAVHEADSGGVFLRSTTIAGASGVPTTGALNVRRRAGSVTLGASTAFVRPLIAATVGSGVSVDFTLRIGLPQLELGAFATSVIPTTTTALTRSADVAAVNTLSPWYNATEGTLFAEVQAAAGFNVAGLFGRYAAIQDALNNNSVEVFFDGPLAGAPRYRVRSGGVNQAVGSSATGYTANTTLKASLAYKVNDFTGVSRGVVDLTDTSGVVPVGPTVLSLGSEGGTINYLNGWLRRVTYYPRRLSNAELQAITA